MKKNKFILIPLLISTIFILSACQVLPWISVERGSGNIIADSRPVSGFSAIQLDGAGRLIITQGAVESLEIQADDNLINDLISDVRGGTLILGYQEKPWRKTILPSQSVIYTLTVIDLDQLTINGAADLDLQTFEIESLELSVNGAGTIMIDDLSAGKLSVNMAGAGSVTISGQAVEESISIDGAGNYRAGNLQSSNTFIEINGLGTGVVWANETLNVNITGAGSVSYFGSPELTQQITGLGNIERLGDK